MKDLAALDPEVIESKAGVTSQNENAREDSSSSSQGTDMVGIAPDVRKRLENKWEKILGPKYKIIVSRTLVSSIIAFLYFIQNSNWSSKTSNHFS